MIPPIEIAGVVLSIVLFAVFIFPTIPIQMKKLYYKINHVTLDAQRRLALSLLYGLLFSIPSALFVIHEISAGSGSSFKTFATDIFPLAAYCFVPIVLAYFRPLAAVPLDLWDFFIIVTLTAPIIVQVFLGETQFLFNQSIHSSKLWFDFHSLYLIAGSMVIYVYSVLRPLPDTGLGREMRLPSLWDCFLTILCAGLLFASLPLLIFTDHVFDQHTNVSAGWVFVNFGCVFVFLALPLELIFRGVIQNLFHARAEVFGDIRKFTSDTDTNHKLQEWDRNARFFPENSLASYLRPHHDNAEYRNTNNSTELSTMTSHHQQQQTEDLLELSLQLGAPAAQKPLAPSNLKSGEYRSFGTKGKKQDDPMAKLHRKNDQYRELLINSTTPSDSNTTSRAHNAHATPRGSKDRSNSAAYIDMDSVIKPEPLFSKDNTNNKQPFQRDSSFGEHNEANYQNVDDIRPLPTQLQNNNNNTSPHFGSIAERSMVSQNGTQRSVVYSTKNVTGSNGVTGANIKDTTSTALGTGFVSNSDAILSALNIQNDLLQNQTNINININGADEIDTESLYAMDPQQQNEYYYDEASQTYRKNPSYQNPEYLGAGKSPIRRLIPKLDENNITFDIDLYKSRQRGYAAQAFEHSPKWPTWQERHARFYNKSKLHWFCLPSKLDYFVISLASLVYAGAMLYNVVTYIQNQQSDGKAEHHIQQYTWFTLFLVLAWQGFLCGFLWRMSSQIWPSVFLTALFLTMASYWMGIDA